MDKLIESYKLIKPSIVAIVQRVSTYPDFPEIIGTGFIVDGEYSLIMTNQHVVDAMKRLPTVKGSDDWPASILILKETDRGVVTLYSDIRAAMHLELDKLPEYSGRQPDMAILRTDLKNLPQASIRQKPTYAEGQIVATAGFPEGHMLLRDGQTIGQIGPTLKSGIVSAVLPFPCPTPHGLLLNIASQGGQSGSPIFDPADGQVIGLLYAGFEEPRQGVLTSQSGPARLMYQVPTDLTFAVPAGFLRVALDKALSAPELKTHLAGEVKDYNEYMHEAYEELRKGIRRPHSEQEMIDSSQVEYPS